MTERARFAHRGSTPPTGYVFEVEHEGEKFVFQASTKTDLLRQLRVWHSRKEVPWPGESEMEARVEDFICRLTPPGFCVGGDRPKVPFLSVPAIRDASKLMLNRVIRGTKTLVPPEEAERRARICANCPQNLHGICTSCAGNEFHDIFQWLIRRGRRTEFDQVLDTCYTCGCLLQAKVHVSLDELAKLEKHSYPENCWLHGTPCHVDPPEEKP